MENAGAKLKKLRLEKGISLEEVQRKTKIQLDVLKSVEDDALANLNPVYINGFLKIYCNFLGIDPGEYLIKDKKNSITAPVKAREKDKELFWNSGKKKFFLKPKIAAIIGLAVVFLFLTLGIVKLIKFISSKAATHKKAGVRLVLPKPQQPKKVKKENKLKTLQKSAVVSPAPVSTDNSEAGVRIGIHALDDCWVQARLDGKVIFQSILKKGRFESWTAEDKVELSLGSAGGVRLEVNGKIIPSLGRKNQVVKNILITKYGLKVGK
ncbi:MAG: RodZ domain-containing protein [Candidatus Omnitrophota bacterium]